MKKNRISTFSPLVTISPSLGQAPPGAMRLSYSLSDVSPDMDVRFLFWNIKRFFNHLTRSGLLSHCEQISKVAILYLANWGKNRQQGRADECGLLFLFVLVPTSANLESWMKRHFTYQQPKKKANLVLLTRRSSSFTSPHFILVSLFC